MAAIFKNVEPNPKEDDFQRAIEDAIMFHEMQLRSMQDLIDKDVAPSSKQWFMDAKGYTKTALTALREKQQREAGCLFCEDGEMAEKTRANYCSHCGRYLRNPGEIGTKID